MWHKLDYQNENTVVSFEEKNFGHCIPMTTSKEITPEREEEALCMVPLFGDNTACSYQSCNRYVAANDYSNFQYLVI